MLQQRRDFSAFQPMEKAGGTDPYPMGRVGSLSFTSQEG